MRSAKGSLQIVPKDGVRRKLHLRTAGQQVDLELIGARFAKGQAIEWHPEQGRFVLPIETEPTASGEVLLQVAGLPSGSYKVVSQGKTMAFQPDGKKHLVLAVPPGTANARVEIIRS